MARGGPAQEPCQVQGEASPDREGGSAVPALRENSRHAVPCTAGVSRSLALTRDLFRAALALGFPGFVKH